MSKTKTKKIVIGALISLATVMQSTLVVFAAAGGALTPDCTEVVNPYNPTGVYATGSDTDKYLHFFTESDCKLHAPYPGPHVAITDAAADSTYTITAAADKDNIHGPWTDHYHSFHNNSIEDAYIWKTYMAAFEITVQSDGFNNTQLAEMECPVFGGQTGTVYDNFRNCVNGALDTAHFGGIRLTKTTVGSTIKLRWDFGVNTGGSGLKPWSPGYNPTVDKGDNPEIFPFDTGYPFDLTYPFNALDYRSFNMGIRLKSKDGLTPKAWSGTTTSRTLIRDARLLKTSASKFNETCSTGGWCAVNPTDTSVYSTTPGVVEAVPNHKSDGTTSYNDYYWVKIGTVSTVWKKKPAETPVTCSALNLSVTQNGAPVTLADVVSDIPMTIDVKPTFSPSGKTKPLKYQWSGTTIDQISGPKSYGQFKDNVSTDPDAGNPFTDSTDDTKVYYTGIPVNGIVNVYSQNADGTFAESVCSKFFTVTKQAPACESISLTPSTVNAPGSTAYTATVKFDDGKTYNTEVTWLQTGGGTFASPAVQKHSSSTNYTNTYNTLNTLGTVTAKVTGVDGAANSSICQIGVKVASPPKPYCSAITLTPSSLKAPETTPFAAKVTYSDGKSYNTEVTWSQTNGSLVPPLVQTHLSSSDFKNTYSTSAKSGSVTAQVTDVLDPKVTNSEICQTGTTVKTPNLACDDTKFTLTSSNGNPLDAGETSTLKASGKRTDGTAVPTMNWTTTGGTLIPQGVCAGLWAPGSTLTNYPSICTVGFGGGPAGTVISVSSIPPESGTICKRQIKVEEKGNKPYCVSVDLNPSKLNTSGNTNLSAKVKFSDGKSYDTTVQWSGNNGSYTASTTKTDTSANPFLNTFKKNANTDPADASVRVIDVPDPDAENSDECYDGTKISTEENKCKSLNLTEKPNGEVCANIEGEFKGQFEWTIDGDSPFLSYKNCQPVPPNTSVKVFATSTCKDQLVTHERPPGLHKGVRLDSSGAAYSTVLSVNSTQTNLEYQIVFETDPTSKTSAYIKDDISSGKIDGHTYPTPKPAGFIDYVEGSMKVNRPECSDKVTENCYTGDIGSGGIYLVKVSGPVVITYKGVIKNSIMKDPAICKGGKVCQEKYLNTAKVPSYEVYDSTGKTIMTGSAQSDDVWVQIFCQYILTRAAGDIYLESDLNAGVDIRQCSKYSSSTGILVVPTTPKKPGLVSTGTNSTEIATITHEICTAGQAGSLSPGLKEFYGQTVVENLSSQICEVKLQPGTAWQQSTITNNIEENKTRLSRWEADWDSIDVNMNSITSDPSYSEKSVYHVKGGDLTISQDYVLNDGDGAKTFIIENGDLYIKGNVSYGACNKQLPDVCNVNDIASLAFIVLNGSVYVDKDVTEMSGVYFVQEGQSEGARPGSGIVAPFNNESSYNQLVIYGSIYGDIEPLFMNRLFAGDPALEEAGIVVRFDERIILNTPPGLRDVLSLTETEVAR